MSASSRRLRRPLAPLVAALLAACAVPAPRTTPPVAEPPPPLVVPPAAAPALPPIGSPVSAPDAWDALRSTFEMADCDSDPAVQTWARRYTSNPRRFEDRLRHSLPRLRFIQEIARKHGVAGEFVLLPWLESRYLPVAGRGRQPAGMWQIVPATAGSLGLRVNRGFDGRMDMAAATEAVMSMLRRYQDELQDWRLTDYAYNAGEYAVKLLVRKHGRPPAAPVIPRLPVRNVTREHLIKLLAISCVIREPARFGVQLPALPSEEHLVAVPIEHSMSMARAAEHAGMSVDALRDYNAAFLDNRVDPNRSSTLLLPGNRADQFVQAMRQASALSDAASLPAKQQAPSADTVVVHAGESLWLIARRHRVSVRDLKRWNHIQGNSVRPGQKLRLAPAQ